MTAPLLATRDTLAKALDGHAYTYPDWFCGCGDYLSGSWADWRDHVADALLASGVVRDSATLADVERRFRTAAELVVQDVRGQRGDHIASLVEDSFAAHFARAAALTEDPS